MVALFDMGHDAVVGGDSVAVAIVSRYIQEDGVDVTVIGKNGVLVSTARANGKSELIPL